MTPPEYTSPIVMDLEKSCSAETQDKTFKTAIRNMFKDPKEDMSKSFSENTNS